MPAALRKPRIKELPALSQLCMRSKAYWGYDLDFMTACKDELTLHNDDLVYPIVIAETKGVIGGVAQLVPDGDDVDLDRLYIDPPQIGRGLGRILFEWCVDTARSMQAKQLLIDSEPAAVGFYEKMGAVKIGECPSGSIPGRLLPRLAYRFR